MCRRAANYCAVGQIYLRERDLDMLYIAGPGHGGPALVANAYLEGTYGEVYPDIGEGVAGLRRLFRQFSFPGGIPSHVSPECPGSIHEGGELGYSLSHAFGAVFDNPDLIVACVIGDGVGRHVQQNQEREHDLATQSSNRASSERG